MCTVTNEDLAAEFEAHADKALALANETFAAAAETWPGFGYWGCPRCRGRLEDDGVVQAPEGLAFVRWRCPACNSRPDISIFVGETS